MSVSIPNRPTHPRTCPIIYQSSSPTYAPKGAGELRSVTPSASLWKPSSSRGFLSHARNVDLTNSCPQVLRDAVLRTAPANAGAPKSEAAKNRYSRCTSLMADGQGFTVIRRFDVAENESPRRLCVSHLAVGKRCRRFDGVWAFALNGDGQIQ